MLALDELHADAAVLQQEVDGLLLALSENRVLVLDLLDQVDELDVLQVDSIILEGEGWISVLLSVATIHWSFSSCCSDLVFM